MISSTATYSIVELPMQRFTRRIFGENRVTRPCLEPIQLGRVVTKKLVMIGERAVRDGCKETVVNRIEASGETIDREIACEHAAIGSENRDRILNDWAVGLDGPG
jgi:hypothetical protein